MSFNSELNQQNNFQEDYYTFLGIPRDASETEISNAYRKLSRLYHPDKHENGKKDAANILFNRTKRAYEVLKDPFTRAIYDTLGEKALDNQMYQIVKRTKTPEEIRDGYEKLMKEKEEQQLKQFLNPRGTVTVGINATSLFKKSVRRRRDKLKINSMGLTAAIDLPVTNYNKLCFSGLVSSQNGQGSHAFTCALKSSISEDLQTECHLTAGQGNFFKFKGVKNLTKQDLIGTSLVFSPDLFGFFSKEINYVHLLSKYLALNMALKTDLINESSFCTTLTYNKEKNKIDLEFQIGIKNSYLSLSYIRSLEINETKIKTKIKFGINGSSIEYGCETRLTKNSAVDATVTIAELSGVSVKLTAIVSNQAYAFDILLSDELVLAPVVYGTICPMITYFCVKKFLIKPYQDNIKKKKKQELSKDIIKRMFEKKKEAELSISLMKDAYYRSLISEKAKELGLIIDVAIYGNSENLIEFVNKNVRQIASENLNLNNEDLNSKQLTVVTIPLQCLIKDSILFLPEASKSNLPGFYDPYPNREKKLYIRYKFRNTFKEVFCADNNKIRLPVFN